MINQLIQIISEEAVVFEDFLALLDRQKEILVTNDVDGLNEVTEQQRLKLAESQRLNRRREELIEKIKQTNAIEGDLSVTRLVEFADQDQTERLLRLKEIILSLNDKIIETRNTNAMLLNQSREFVARTMEMLAKLNNPKPTYSPHGTEKSVSTVMVDRRI